MDAFFAGVQDALVEALEVEAAAVTPEARLLEDLGADSLDLLDILFHLEQRFGCRIQPGQLQRLVESRLAGAPVEVGGVFSPAALVELQRLMPEVPPAEFRSDLRPADLPRLFRVRSLMALVARVKEGTA